MQRRGIQRSVCVVVALGVVGIVAVGSQLASASGGGGCGRVVSDARGTQVRIHQFCFTPTILRIRPRQTVTWINTDPFAHTVMGANAAWGSFAELVSGHRVTYRFVQAGVYPYVCTFHPGMVGAVIVGSGNGLGDARTTTTEAGPVTLVAPSPVSEIAAANDPIPSAARTGTGPGTWAVLVAVGLMAALALVLAVVGRRRPSPS